MGNRVASDGVWDYTYDGEGNQLVSAVEKQTSTGPTLNTVDTTFDVYSNLSTRTHNGTTTKHTYQIEDQAPGTTHTVHRLLADLDNANSLLTRYRHTFAGLSPVLVVC